MYKARSISVRQIDNERFELVIPDEDTEYIGQIRVTKKQMIELRNKLNNMFLD